MVLQHPPSRLIGETSDRLITAIAIGEFPTGARLPNERELSSLLGVGRTSTRAALAVLHADGLIKTLRGRSGGSFVHTQWSDSSGAAVVRWMTGRWPELRDRLEAARRLEGAIARAAAEARDDTDLAVLEDRLEACRRAAGSSQKQASDANLHLAVVDAAKNKTLKTLRRELMRKTSLASPMRTWGSPLDWEVVEERIFHADALLAAAIIGQRGNEAERIARERGRIDLELVQQAVRRAKQSSRITHLEVLDRRPI